MAEESPLSATGNLTEAQFERMAHPQAPDGLIGSPADTAPVSVSGGTVIVRAGLSGLLRGYPWASGATDVTFTPTLTGATRVDLVVLRLYRDDGYRVGAALRTGTSDTAPTPFMGVGATDWYEIPLAEIRVANGALTLLRTRAWYLGDDGQALCTSGTRPPHTPGRQIFETDTGRGYISNGARWVPILDDSGTTTPTMASGWAVGGLTLHRLNGVAYFAGTFKRTGAALTVASSTVTAMTIPVGFRPRVSFTIAARATLNNADAMLRMSTTGTVGVDLYNAGISSGNYIDTPASSWPVAVS